MDFIAKVEFQETRSQKCMEIQTLRSARSVEQSTCEISEQERLRKFMSTKLLENVMILSVEEIFTTPSLILGRICQRENWMIVLIMPRNLISALQWEVLSELLQLQMFLKQPQRRAANLSSLTFKRLHLTILLQWRLMRCVTLWWSVWWRFWI